MTDRRCRVAVATRKSSHMEPDSDLSKCKLPREAFRKAPPGSLRVSPPLGRIFLAFERNEVHSVAGAGAVPEQSAEESERQKTGDAREIAVAQPQARKQQTGSKQRPTQAA